MTVDLIGILLERRGFEVVKACSAEEGLRAAYRTHPDLILLDIMMPDMDGWEVCRRLRELSDVPILFLTAKDDTRDLVRGLDLGADDYITKPYDNDALIARIKAHLRRVPKPVVSEELVFDGGNVRINFISREVRVRGKPVHLTPKEFNLLGVLARNAGRVLMMASKFRYTDDMIAARSLVRAGILGTVVHFENTFAGWLDVTKRWNADPAVSGGGVLIDNGTHSVDIARYLLGPVAEVLAWHGPRVQDIPVEDTTHLSLRTASGVTGTVDLSWSMHKERESYVDVFGTEGVLSVGWKRSRYRQNRAPDWVTFGKGYDKLGSFVAQLRNFAGCVRGGEQPLITGEDALASVQVIETAYASEQAGCWRPVPRD